MKRFTLIILFSILALAVKISAQAEFSMVPPRTTIEGRNFSLTYRLKNSDESASPKAPEIEGCRLLYGPATSTMQSYQNINGHATSSVTVEYTFTYKAEKAGTYTIPAVSINVGGKTLSSKSGSIKVLPPDSNSGSNSDDVTIDNASSQSSSRDVSDKDVFIRIILNKSKAYKEEAIECTMKLYTKYSSINNISALTPPVFDGFLIEDDDNFVQSNDTEHYNGQNYLTAILKKYIIFPQKSGKLTINSGEYDITIVQYERVNMGFFATSRPVEKVVRVKPGNLIVNILPLPEPVPAGFSGAVGNYQISSSISSTSLRTNEAATLTLKITGSGDIKYIQEPQIEFPTEFEQYTPRTDINTRIAGNTVSGTNSIEYTFVPQSTGDFTIPAKEFIYFDPAREKYITLSTEPYSIKVSKGAGTAVASSDQQDIAAKVTDILHIKPNVDDQQYDITPVAYKLYYWILYIILLIGLAVAVVIYKERIKMSADVTGRKIARASKVARQRLKEANSYLTRHENEKVYEALLRAVWGFLSDKLSIPASQLSRQNISEKLSEINTPASLIDRIIGVIDNCEMARFTPGMNDASTEKAYDEVSEIMKEMDNIKK
ncbi:MAG: BatD family protein [Muribaculaceae bacterium]|nr:BatD family protein [Muribaculaceae bacterium]MDE7368342.1 BatD family protein [Muribaculaceae bacterium]